MLVDFILHKANGTDTVELNKSIDGYSVVLNPKLHDVYNQVSYVEFDVAMSMDNYIEIGDWIEVDGKKYYSLTNFASFNARIAKGGTYNVRFYSPEQWLYKANMYATNEIYSGGVYSWERVDNTIVTVGNLESFGRWLCWNINAQQNTRMFKLGNVPTGMNEQYEVLDFNPSNCLSALYSICKTYKVRYEVAPNTEASPDSQYIINFYDTDEVFPVTFKYEEENGLYKLELTGCDEEVYTQFEIAGSTENIPSSYRDTRLRLSESISALSILDYPDLYDKWGRSIKILTYENIKPTRTGTVTDIVVDDIYSFIDSSLIGATWSPVGGTIQIVEGPLMGFSFECDYFNSANGRVHIKPMTESNGMELPSADLSYYRFTAGATPTRYNVVGIALPNEYIEDAEARLLAAAMNDTSYYSDIRASYSLAISGTLLEEGEYEINAGVLVPIRHLGIGLDRSVRVQSITYDLSKPKYYDIEEIQLSDFRQEGLMDMVTEGVRKSVATLKDVGYTNKLNTFANSVSTIKQGIAKSLGYESWEDFMEKTWNGEDGSWEPSTIIVDSLINSQLINVETLIAREAFINNLVAKRMATDVDDAGAYVEIETAQENGVKVAQVRVQKTADVYAALRYVNGVYVEFINRTATRQTQMTANNHSACLLDANGSTLFEAHFNPYGLEVWEGVWGVGTQRIILQYIGGIIDFVLNGLPTEYNTSSVNRVWKNPDGLLRIGDEVLSVGVSEVSTLVSTPITYSSVNASISTTAQGTISFASNIPTGKNIMLHIEATASLTVSFAAASGITFCYMDESSWALTSGEVLEISVWCYSAGKYSISSKKTV